LKIEQFLAQLLFRLRRVGKKFVFWQDIAIYASGVFCYILPKNSNIKQHTQEAFNA
jgi:hypothetical protein